VTVISRLVLRRRRRRLPNQRVGQDLLKVDERFLRPRRHLRLKKLNLAVMMGVAIMTTVETTIAKVDARITAHRDLSRNHL
jgi:hypothetical protein